MKRVLCALFLMLSIVAHADLIQQSTTYSRTVLMTSSTDHITGATGLTLAVTESKAGATFAASGATVTEVGNGWYKIALTTTDTGTLGAFNLHCTATGADPTDTADQIVAFNPNDASLLGLTGIATLSNQTSIAASIAALPTPAAFYNALFATSRWQRLEANEVGNYTRNPSTGVITLTRQDGTTFTVTTSVDSNSHIIGRVVSQ